MQIACWMLLDSSLDMYDGVLTHHRIRWAVKIRGLSICGFSHRLNGANAFSGLRMYLLGCLCY